jgi:hypothetical protein
MTGSSKIRMARLARTGEADRFFDLVPWMKMGAEKRFEGAWNMVLEVNTIKGKDIDESRLQRHVQNIRRAPR